MQRQVYVIKWKIRNRIEHWKQFNAFEARKSAKLRRLETVYEEIDPTRMNGIHFGECDEFIEFSRLVE